MYALGELVCYGAHGVCRISATEDQRVGGKRISYLVLVPIEQPGSKYLVPQSSSVAMGKIRPLLTKEDLLQLLSQENICGHVWIPDEGVRKLRYKELLAGTSPDDLAAMLRAVYAEKKKQLADGKKFHLCDDNFLRDAEKLLSSEVAAVMALTCADALQYIRNNLNP